MIHEGLIIQGKYDDRDKASDKDEGLIICLI